MHGSRGLRQHTGGWRGGLVYDDVLPDAFNGGSRTLTDGTMAATAGGRRGIAGT